MLDAAATRTLIAVTAPSAFIAADKRPNAGVRT
jgi:hypothetical protein